MIIFMNGNHSFGNDENTSENNSYDENTSHKNTVLDEIRTQEMQKHVLLILALIIEIANQALQNASLRKPGTSI